MIGPILNERKSSLNVNFERISLKILVEKFAFHKIVENRTSSSSTPFLIPLDAVNLKCRFFLARKQKRIWIGNLG